MLGSENWCVKVDDRVYGPYSSEQVRKYAHEGRLAGWSLIAPAGSRSWREARAEPSFASFFGEKSAPTAAAANAFGKRDVANDQPAIKGGKRPAPALANFVIVFEIAEGAANRLESAVHGLGTAFRVAENVWSVTSDLTAVGVRNALAPYLSPREAIFVIDATHGRTSWQNFAPELHAKISAAYTAGAASKRAS